MTASLRMDRASFDLLDAEENERVVGGGLQAAIRIADINVGLAKRGGEARDFTGAIENFGLDDFCLGLGQLPAAQNLLRSFRVVHDESRHRPSSDQERLKGKEVCIVIRECPAECAKRTGVILC